MRITVLPSLFIFSSFIVTACSVESTSPPPSESKPVSTSPSTDPADPPPSKSKPAPAPAPSQNDPDEPAPKTPPKPFFDATVDGDAMVFDETTIELEDGSYKLRGTVESQSPYGGSDETLTVHINKGESGTAACDDDKRSVDLWFKDDDGAIRGLGTSYVYGGCTMKLDTSIPGYVIGEAQGTLGGAKQKSFSVKFAQKLP